MKKYNFEIIISSIIFKELKFKVQSIADEILKKAIIKKCPKCDQDDRPESQQQWCLYTKDESKLLGRHPTKEKAKAQERAVQFFKHKGESEAIPTDGNLNLFNEI
jgi:hypothetical protein